MKIRRDILSEDERELLDFEKLAKRMDSFNDSDNLFECIQGIYSFLCRSVNAKKTIRNTKLIERILIYMNSHYMNSDLCLYSVASEFELTEKYLSQFFKDQVNDNFTTYIEKLRLEKTIELMKQSDLSINDIAISVGYDRNNTFYRAFKRIYGISPTTYKMENCNKFDGD